MRNRFDEQLFELNREIIEMGAMCEEAIAAEQKAAETYISSLLNEIKGLKQTVNSISDSVDENYQAIEDGKYNCKIIFVRDDGSVIKETEYAFGDTIKFILSMEGKSLKDEILAVLTTGAYNYSMASNYNRIPRPPVVMVKDGEARIVVKRETYEQVSANDI